MSYLVSRWWCWWQEETVKELWIFKEENSLLILYTPKAAKQTKTYQNNEILLYEAKVEDISTHV
jgi:hypothetical protein